MGWLPERRSAVVAIARPWFTAVCRIWKTRAWGLKKWTPALLQGRGGTPATFRHRPYLWAYLRSATFAPNAAWLTAVLIAGDLLAWLRGIGLSGALRGATPARLRYTLLHVAGRLIRTGRRVVVRVAAAWPWSGPLRTAVARCAALPSGPSSPTAPSGRSGRFSGVGGSRSRDPPIPHAPRRAALAGLATGVPTREEIRARDVLTPQGTGAVSPSTTTGRFGLAALRGG
jgi:hypothetical protein